MMIRKRARLCSVLAALVAQSTVAHAQPSQAQPVPTQSDSLLARCWPAQALAAADGERRPLRSGATRSVVTPQAGGQNGIFPPGGERGAVRRVELPKGLKLVALTLDLCEQPGEIAGYDGPIFDILRRHGAKATVFAGGRWLMSHPERAQQLIADPRLEMASHGWAHRNARGLDARALEQEIRLPLDAYATQRARLAQRQCAAAAPEPLSRIPAQMGLYRFPYGACHAAALDELARNGLRAIQWDVSTGDASPAQSAATIAAAIMRNSRPGSIILAHANGRGYNTAAALAIAIPRMQAEGWRFVTVSELMAAGRPVIVPTCYDARPGDTDRYDALFGRPRAASSERGGNR